MISSFNELHQMVKDSQPKRVALVAAEDPVLIEAAKRAQEEGLARFILFGNSRKIESLNPPDASSFEIVDSQNPAIDAINYIHADKADLLMKGKIQTGDLLRAILNRDTGLRQGELLNHIAVIESPHYHKLLFISDGGINLHLDENVYQQMVVNITQYLKLLGIESPHFGMMTLVETVSKKIPETIIAQKVVKVLSKKVSIEGPIAPDVALSREAATKKGLESEIAGEIDVFLMPSTTAANHLVKGLSALGGCKVGGVIVGASVPVILLSRSDDAETKYRSILLGLV
ncbi:MAG: phosphate butyryltransferase [Candidatus Marinimicrobia bacterium]|jgi:phosphate butyryltransferase|nr:phosphate butyryltransferase [Candidatus Neomarinimicrobiota bacterium]MBT3576856.1 phosphate butyryltransferase [Candidatus Neomarinimicrobiota bacterium]MBT3679064.1 phosphate butyryltransferase [Candidatus Neomarinimicrobiota bacterium]MBT3950321.1 phosphate butyryltransferase [Candidatus Neomarinimicrobiota bacterium]MBT4252065.1 phosphate butyryltransferase [Candidatus Neomarinimicrobiota bacterium]